MRGRRDQRDNHLMDLLIAGIDLPHGISILHKARQKIQYQFGISIIKQLAT